MDAGLWKFFSSIKAMKLVTQNYQKKDYFQEIPEEVSSDEVVVKKKYLLQKGTCSE